MPRRSFPVNIITHHTIFFLALSSQGRDTISYTFTIYFSSRTSWKENTNHTCRYSCWWVHATLFTSVRPSPIYWTLMFMIELHIPNALLFIQLGLTISPLFIVLCLTCSISLFMVVYSHLNIRNKFCVFDLVEKCNEGISKHMSM